MVRMHWLRSTVVFGILGIAIGLVARELGLNANRVVTIPDQPVTRRLEVGKALRIPAVSFVNSQMTLVIVESADCQHCAESGPFHESVKKIAAGNGMAVVRVVPDIVRNAVEPTLASERIVTTNLQAIGIEGTPTIMLVGSDGLIKGLWIGKILPEHRGALLAKLEHPDADLLSSPDGSTPTTAAQHFSCCADKSTLLDVREREVFKAGHRPGARNIPLTELLARAGLEVSRENDIIVDCSLLPAIDCKLATKLLDEDSFTKIRLLNAWTRSVFCKPPVPVKN